MGTFAGLYKEEGARIPEDKREEFQQKIETVFRESGMMEVRYVTMFDMELLMLRKLQMYEYGIDVAYNYFEDDSWENAGYSKKENIVWSNKVGTRKFCLAILAAYVLEEIYTDGVAVAMLDCDPVMNSRITGWLNYILDEKFSMKNRDPWALYEAYHYENEDKVYIPDGTWKVDITEHSFFGWLTIKIVEKGVGFFDTLMKTMNSSGKEQEDRNTISFASIIRLMRKEICRYKEVSISEKDVQIISLLGLVKEYYSTDIATRDFLNKGKVDSSLALRFTMVIYDIPAIMVKVIAETYDKDFWELWSMVRREIKSSERKFPLIKAPAPEEPVRTEDFFCVSCDDMIPFWDGTDKVMFSVELENWFTDLKEKFDKIMSSDDVIKEGNLLKWILGLIKYASYEYYRIYTFEEFFEETADHLNDKRYLVLWKIYEDLLHDPEIEDAGSVIFAPIENKSMNRWSYDETRRPLSDSWYFMQKEKKQNKARNTLRRYNALVANRKLREKVFGF